MVQNSHATPTAMASVPLRDHVPRKHEYLYYYQLSLVSQVSLKHNTSNFSASSRWFMSSRCLVSDRTFR